MNTPEEAVRFQKQNWEQLLKICFDSPKALNIHRLKIEGWIEGYFYAKEWFGIKTLKIKFDFFDQMTTDYNKAFPRH